MSFFKDAVKADIRNTFINTSEFGEWHDIDGKAVAVMLDIDRLNERRDKAGLSAEEIYFYVASSDLPRRPVPENIMMFDRRPFRIVECPENDGVYEIVLERQNSGG